ncbi:MAG: TerB family tellurite resistance protein [Deltaproteobacteria bacterium]|nr:TerB family tellurite resistance protein [Deltaproteobacteria bacterium]
MHEQNAAILKGLVAVAWADGEFADAEAQALDGLLAAFGATETEANDLRTYAKTPRKIDDIPLKDLSADDRRILFSHAVLLTWVDGSQHEKEREFLDELAKHLRLSDEEKRSIDAASTERAKKYLQLLD